MHGDSRDAYEQRAVREWSAAVPPYHPTEPLPVPSPRAWWWPWLLAVTAAVAAAAVTVAVWEWWQLAALTVTR